VNLSRFAVIVLATALVAACSPPPPRAIWLPPEPTRPAPPPPPEITLAFAGDVHFAGRTLDLLDTPETAFGPMARTLAGADLAMVNLETAVTARGRPAPKEFHFRAPASAFTAVRAAGVDVLTVANNHVLDYGPEGLVDTLDAARRAGVPAVGAGPTAPEAYAPWLAQVRGVRIAFLGFSQVGELWQEWRATADRPGIAVTREPARAAAAVRAAGTVADVTVVYVHWGSEGSACPTPEMRDFARAMAAAGADVVVGTHAHLLLGEDWHGSTYVQYGLGNFVWWRDDAFSNDTGVLVVRLRGTRVAGARLVPAVISRRTGQPLPAVGRDARRIDAVYEALSTSSTCSPSW
jgi:poly-gamma-glutamate synthesis protein (capsule biosynthesis protein)